MDANFFVLQIVVLFALWPAATYGLPPSNPSTCGAADPAYCGLTPGGVPPDPEWTNRGTHGAIKVPPIPGGPDTRRDLKPRPKPGPSSVAAPILAGGTSRGSQLQPGQTLFGRSDDQILSNTVLFRMQSDCNLVAYHCKGSVWTSNTNGKGQDCRAEMQQDGNLVVYDGNHRPLWASNTNRFPGGRLVAQDDGNVVIYTATTPRWSTNSWIRR